MKLIKPKAEYLPQASGLEGAYRQIELAGRTCYKSSPSSPSSPSSFVDRMIASKHCYTGDSEVLTENGWVKWKEYRGQKVAVVNTDLSFGGYEVPQRVVHHNYTGKFYEYPTLGLKVTEGHRMFGVFRLGNNDFYNNSMYSLFTCNGEFVDNNKRHKTNGERMFKTPRHCTKPIHTNPYMELVGFWLGDGCHTSQTKNKLVFHLKKKRKIEYLKELSQLLGWKFTTDKGNYYRIEHGGIGQKFNTLYYSNGNKKIDIGSYYSAEDIHSIITGLINSDGSYGTNTRTITYTSTSKSIIDWLCTYAPLAGYTISYRGVCKQSEGNLQNVYKVLFLVTDYTICNDSRYEDSKVLITEETEDVFCVTVSTGLIMVRGTNGITTVCGNCAMLEHGTVYLKDYRNFEYENNIDLVEYPNILDKYSLNKYSKYKEDTLYSYVTTNLRVLVENNWLDDLKYLCEPTEFHEKRYTFKLTTSIGVTRELIRHRTMSFAEMSTRYCNFSKNKFDNQVSFCIPEWLETPEGINRDITAMREVCKNKEEKSFYSALYESEIVYKHLIRKGWQTQQAREVLPLCTATEIVVTGFASDWRHFFDLRLFEKTGKVHPNMKQLAELMKAEAEKQGIWEDIISKPSKFE